VLVVLLQPSQEWQASLAARNHSALQLEVILRIEFQVKSIRSERQRLQSLNPLIPRLSVRMSLYNRNTSYTLLLIDRDGFYCNSLGMMRDRLFTNVAMVKLGQSASCESVVCVLSKPPYGAFC